MALLERLYVEITADTSGLEGDLKAATEAAQRMGRTMRSVGRDLSAAVTLPLAAVGAAAVKMASDAEEAANKFNVVMGGSASEVRARLEELTDTIPLTLSELQNFAAGVQDFLVPMGVARDEAAGLSAQVVELAGDLASFNNVGADQVLEAIKSALAGSSEPMRRFGVDTREAALQQVALEQGLISAGDELDNTARALAVVAAIQKDSTDAIGDAARTVDSTANSFRFLARDVRDLTEQLGRELIPIITPIVQELGDLVEGFTELDEGTKRVIVTFGLLAGAAGPVLIAMGSVVGAITKLTTLLAGGGALFAALSPAGWLAAGLIATAAAWATFRDRTDDARGEIVGFRDDMQKATQAVREHELALLNIEYFDNLDQIQAIEEEWNNVGRITEEQRLLLNRLERRQEELILRTVALAEAWDPVVQATQSVRENVEGAASAASSIQVPAPSAANVGSGGFGFGFDLPALQIPENISVLSDGLGDLSNATEATTLSIGNATQAVGLLDGQLGEFARGFLSGGVVGGIVAGIGSIIRSSEEAARRIQAAADAVRSAVDSYVDSLAGLDEFERAERQAIEGARDVLQAFADQVTAGIKSDKLREALERQFDEAIENLDLDHIRELLAQFGPDGAAVLAELERRLQAVNDQRAEEAARLKEEEEALKRANEARREAARLGFFDSVGGAIEAQRLSNTRNDLGEFERQRFDLERWAQELSDEINRQLIDGTISALEAARLFDQLGGVLSDALDDVNEAQDAAADSARRLAEADRFRQQIDLENLEVRLLVAQGLDDEAFALRQQIELLQAVEEGRSAEYIALLQQIQAQELANREAQKAAATQREVAKATQEATRALDGTIRVLNGPAGFTAALYRNQALRGTPDFGVSAGSPSFGGGGSSQFNITIKTQPGQDNEAIGAALYEQIVREHQRRRGTGAINPFGGL